MTKEYLLELTKHAAKRYQKLTQHDSKLKVTIQKVFIAMTKDPFAPILRTHKVHISGYGLVYSSSVTGDLRIIWEIRDDKVTILILNLGGHSGSKSVYK